MRDRAIKREMRRLREKRGRLGGLGTPVPTEQERVFLAKVVSGAEVSGGRVLRADGGWIEAQLKPEYSESYRSIMRRRAGFLEKDKPYEALLLLKTIGE